MSTMESLLAHPAIPALGWALVHSLWQGTVVAILTALVLRGLRRRSSDARYLVACLGLVVLAALPIGTFISQWEGMPAAMADPTAQTSPTSPTIQSGPIAASVDIAADIAATPWTTRAAGLLNPLLPWLVLAWVAGVSLMSLRLLGGWLQVMRLANRYIEPVERKWEVAIDELAHRLAVSRPVRLLQSAAVEVPTVVGFLRPVILVPASAFTGLDPRQLEALLAHELAHIRRHDTMINLVQCLVETAYFYHPAARWLSSRIRDERENCCDDLAVSVSGSVRNYATALAEMERLRAGSAAARLAMASNGGSLTGRIRRLVGLDPDPSVRLSARPAAAALMLASIFVLGATQFAAGEDKSAGTPAPECTVEKTIAVCQDGDAQVFVVGDGGTWQCAEGAAGKNFTFTVCTDENGQAVMNGTGIGHPMAFASSDHVIELGLNWQGLDVEKLQLDTAQAMGLKSTNGVVVRGVRPDSPAAVAGLQEGDVITSLNGTAVSGVSNFMKSARGLEKDTTAEISILRNGEPKTVSLAVGEQDASAPMFFGPEGTQMKVMKFHGDDGQSFAFTTGDPADLNQLMGEWTDESGETHSFSAFGNAAFPADVMFNTPLPDWSGENFEVMAFPPAFTPQADEARKQADELKATIDALREKSAINDEAAAELQSKLDSLQQSLDSMAPNVDHMRVRMDQLQGNADVMKVQAFAMANAGGTPVCDIDMAALPEWTAEADEPQFEGALAKPVTLEFENTPLQDAIQQVCDQAGVRLDVPTSIKGNFSLNVTDRPAGEVLNMMLRPIDKCVTQDEDGNVVLANAKPRMIFIRAGGPGTPAPTAAAATCVPAAPAAPAAPVAR